MSEPKLISPLLDHFVMGPAISDHHGVCCCPAMTKDSNKRYIIKVISIPASQVQLDALLLAGAYSSKYAALAYYQELASGVIAEAEILKKLSRFEGFLPYEGHQIIQKEDDEIGYQVYLKSPYRCSLDRYMRNNPMTQLKAVNLGLDLCASMVMCRRAGYLYVDLKPGNIFINEKNEFCIGDLGFIRMDSLKYASLPDKYRSVYTAPELNDVLATMNETVDTYAIGMVLYQIYNDGKLPGSEELTPPMYADYEMAEIIMKAIHLDPEQRWKDPMEMGQALVAYMQRNSVNDVPIIPIPEPATIPEEPVQEALEEVLEEAPPEVVMEPEVTPVVEEDPVPEIPEVPEVPVEPNPEVPVQPEEGSADPETPPEIDPETQDDATDLTFMDGFVQDDTTPDENSAADITYDELSDETSDILAQADELLLMQAPEPVVAPEPIEVPVPAPIESNNVDPIDPEPAPAEPEDPEAAPATVDTTESEPETIAPEMPEEAPEEAPAEPITEPEPVSEAPAEEAVSPAPKKRKGIVGIIAWILIIALIFGGVTYGYHYYNNVYLQTITDMEISGYDTIAFVKLNTEIDDSLLTVTATDSYGNTFTSSVSDHMAVFKTLNPDTIYKITVTIDGFHELKGFTTGTYTTPAQTKIVSFDATAGVEPGSVILTFTVEGKDSNNWTITYSSEGETEKSQTFSGHILSVSGLTPGKEYTFRLTCNEELYMIGTDSVSYRVAPLIFAENLAITQCTAEGLIAVWNAPAGSEGITWIVRCYGDNGYDQTIETTDLTATFTGIDVTQGCTVDVTAKGMSTGVMTHISARTASITGSVADTSKPLTLKVTWAYEGDTPVGGWLVTYTLKDSGITETILVTEPSIFIYPAMPDDEYDFTVQAADGITVFNNTFSHTAGKVQVFSGYGVSADNMSFTLVKTPSQANWSWKDLASSSYTEVFKSGEKASFVVKLNKKYQNSDDYIDILFVVRNKQKEIVCTSSTGASWTYLWDNGYCELDIPTLPTEAGSYSIDIYFNGMAAARVPVSIK